MRLSVESLRELVSPRTRISLLEAAAVQTPVTGKRVPQAVNADDVYVARVLWSRKARRVEYVVQRLAQYTIVVVARLFENPIVRYSLAMSCGVWEACCV